MTLQIKTALCSLFLAVASFMMVSCEVESNGTPSLTLDCYELNISGTGGDIPLFYSVGKPVKGAKPEVNTTVEWITVKETTSSRITLTIEPNNSLEPRQAILRIKYPGVDRAQTVYVNQSKAVLDKFSFEVTDVTYKSCTARYIPADAEMQYMANIIDIAYFEQSGVSTEEAFIEAEMSNYLTLAAQYGMSLEEMLLRTELINRGETTRQFDGMQHGNRYLVYSYGIELEGDSYTLTTPIHFTVVNLPMPSMYSDVTFTISANQSSQGTNTISITPKNWDGYYNIQIAPDNSVYYVPQGTAFESYHLRSMANAFFTNARSAMLGGSTVEQFLSSTCYSGPQQLNVTLDRSHKYMIIVFAVESEEGAIPVMRSMPSTCYIN